MLELGMHGICEGGEVSDGLPYLDERREQCKTFCPLLLREQASLRFFLMQCRMNYFAFFRNQ